MEVQRVKRFALLMAARDSDYVKSVYGGYYNVFVEAFADEGEKWDLFRVVEGEFPDMDDLQKYEGFVISGSPYDAYGDENWILELCFLLQTLFVIQKKVLGICFGHQVLCRALGGKVGKAYSGWDIGIRKVRFTEDITFHGYFDDNLEEIPPSLSIIECHQDEVCDVPEGAQVLACSDKTRVEMFTFGDNILGIQGHPEYTKDILDNLIDRLLLNGSIEVDDPYIVNFIGFQNPLDYNFIFSFGDNILGIQGHPEYTKDILDNLIDRLLLNCSIEKGFAEEAKMKLMKTEADRKYWEGICKSFLKGGWITQSQTDF